MAVATLKREECMFCRSKLLDAREIVDKQKGRILKPDQTHDLEADNTGVGLCGRCGWWTAYRYEKMRTGDLESTVREYGSYGVLKNLSLADLSIPIEEVRDYLTARYQSRNEIHPRLFEETVATVFKDLGYSVEVTAYSGDGGIDVILSKSSERVGVQVKRYQDAIEAEQIRSFIGALVIGDYTRGIYVTTSHFRKGAKETAEKGASIRGGGIPIELIDAPRFYEALGIAQSTLERSASEWLAFVKPLLKLFDEHSFLESYYTH